MFTSHFCMYYIGHLLIKKGTCIPGEVKSIIEILQHKNFITLMLGTSELLLSGIFNKACKLMSKIKIWLLINIISGLDNPS